MPANFLGKWAILAIACGGTLILAIVFGIIIWITCRRRRRRNERTRPGTPPYIALANLEAEQPILPPSLQDNQDNDNDNNNDNDNGIENQIENQIEAAPENQHQALMNQRMQEAMVYINPAYQSVTFDQPSPNPYQPLSEPLP